MVTLREKLQSADPIRYERVSDLRFAEMRAATIAVAETATSTRRLVDLRLRPAIAAALIALVLAVAGLQLWSRGNTIVQAAVRFEVRLAEDQPAAGLQAARIANSNRTIYLHPKAIVTNTDIANSRVVPGANPSQFWIDVRFTQAGAQKIHDATAGHLGNPIAILIDGDVVTAPTVRSAIGDAAVINGDYTREKAEQIVNGMSLAR